MNIRNKYSKINLVTIFADHRVFNIDVERCQLCGGNARVIAAIEDKALIHKILAQLDNKLPCAQAPLPQVRAPPEPGVFS